MELTLLLLQDFMNYQALLTEVNAIARQAGAAILEIYGREAKLDVTTKENDSPLTEADLAAHRTIVDALQELTPALPILSEESKAISWEQRQSWQTYWLVDPLDGTKEFINRNGEFTVNIALIDNGRPVLGVVYVPVLDIGYTGSPEGAWKEESGKREAIQTAAIQEDQHKVSVVASRSHKGEDLEAWLERAAERFPQMELLSMGSSLKICLVAEGKADIYPRLALTSEWDTGAAQAILEAAGGLLTDADFNIYRYNQKEDILNPFFFAIGDRAFDWQSI
jgi:3'(2'), 5'-bisphosphate nucleotidase